VKKLLLNLALSCGVFLLCAAALEGILRLNHYGNLEIYQPDPKLYWKLKPNQDCFTKIDRKPVHVNSEGTRGPEFEADKLAGTIRVLSLGDSRTFGWGLTDEETYSRRLERLLQERVGNAKKVEVINAGVNAWSYPQMLVYFRDFALRYKPDFVVLGDANLWTQFSEKNSPEFVQKFMTRVRIKNLLRRFAIYHYVVEVKLKDFYERNRTKFIPVDPAQDTLFKQQQQSDPGSVFSDAIEQICQVAKANGIQAILLDLPTVDQLNSTPSLDSKAKHEIHERLSVSLVEMAGDLQREGKALYLPADPVHLNARGNQLIARRLFQTIQTLIQP
jgi:lysophospholipase L1-like esterase